MKSIYNIEQEYLNLAEQIIDQGGEVSPEQETQLAINKEELQIKSVKYGYVVKQAETDIEAIDAEIKRLQGLKSSREGLINKLKETVSTAMDLYGIEEIKLQNLKISFHPSTASEIVDEKLIPAKYKKKVVTVTLDKKAILADLRANKKIKGAVLKNNKKIQFK